jgi:ferrous iron transport protein B
MDKTLALVGNPNTGKTSIFNNLTGTRQHIGNWPGVTVEKKEGRIKTLPGAILVDLPGIYSLSAQTLEERLAVTYLINEASHMLINIVDASNLERNLYLSVQLLEMGLPTVLCLNMMDIAEKRGLKIDVPALSQKLGVPVIPSVARRAKGDGKLVHLIHRHIPSPVLKVPYPSEIEEALHELDKLLATSSLNLRPSRRWLALMWLEGNRAVKELLRSRLPADLIERMEAVRSKCPADLDQQIRNARYTLIEKIVREVTRQNQSADGLTWSDHMDRLLLHPVIGIPIFLLLMYLVFQITFTWVGAPLSDYLDSWLNGPVFTGVSAALEAMGSPDWFTRLMIDGVLSGVGAVLVFVPQIAILFLCLSYLEDSGYMARVSVLMDRFMSMIGLSGKAFIPLILGFGCNVPAIMTTRTLEDPKSRLVTTLISPFMSCSARLPVYSLFAAAFFKENGAAVVFTLYVTGILVAILTAFVLKKRVPAEEGVFLLEMPPYHAPMLKSLFLHTWDKTRGFVRKAGTIIFGMTVVIWFLGNFSWQGFVPMEQSWLAAIGGWIAPLFAPLGFDTWQAGVSLVVGFMAKELIVSTMGIVYGIGTEGKLGELLPSAFDQPAALAFLFFVLLYTPCVAALATIKRETGSWKWTLFSVGYSMAVAWITAFIVYYVSQLIL